MATRDQKKKFIERILPDTLFVQENTGIAWIIPIVQAALESNYGLSKLTLVANNLFGFTGDSWKSKGLPVYEIETREYQNGKWIITKRPFRKYADWKESVEDWARLIMTANRYHAAYQAARAGDVAKYGYEVHKAGYATDPKYPEKIASFGTEIKILFAELEKKI